MKFKGGYNVPLKGNPSPEIIKLPDPVHLLIPLFSRRFDFSELCVKNDDTVKPGQVLAKDPSNYTLPLFAPRGGTAKLDTETRHIILENLQPPVQEAATAGSDPLSQGAWHFISDAFTGGLPDPAGSPQAIIISTGSLEPFITSGEVLLTNRAADFEKGITRLTSLAGGSPVYLALPRGKPGLQAQFNKAVGQNAQVRQIKTPPKYPFDNTKLLAQLLELEDSPDKGPVWALDIAGVIALGAGLPGVSRIISVGGPGAKAPAHTEIMVGYPVQAIREACQEGNEVRVINGGVLTGETMGEEQQGLDVECGALTLIPEKTTRDFIGFARVGIKQNSFSHTFLSAIIPGFREQATTGVRGEGRPCLTCGFCERVCPAGIVPFIVRRFVEKNRLEEAQRVGLEKCIRCGLCSYVCTSKIDIKTAHQEAQDLLRQERLSQKEG